MSDEQAKHIGRMVLIGAALIGFMTCTGLAGISVQIGLLRSAIEVGTK